MTTEQPLTGTAVMVTGASSGIGEAAARRFAAPRRRRRPGRATREIGWTRSPPSSADRPAGWWSSRPMSPTAPGRGGRRAGRRRARPPRHPGQQRRRDAPRSGCGRTRGGVGADGPGERPRAALLREGRAPPPDPGRRDRSSSGGRPGEHLLRRRTPGPPRQRCLQRHQARRRRLQRVAAPGGHPSARAGLAHRARRGGDRAGRAQPSRGPRRPCASGSRTWSGSRPRTSPTRSSTS